MVSYAVFDNANEAKNFMTLELANLNKKYMSYPCLLFHAKRYQLKQRRMRLMTFAYTAGAERCQWRIGLAFSVSKFWFLVAVFHDADQAKIFMTMFLANLNNIYMSYPSVLFHARRYQLKQRRMRLTKSAYIVGAEHCQRRISSAFAFSLNSDFL